MHARGLATAEVVFARRLLIPIFTNNKLVDDTNNVIEIHLVDTRVNHVISPTSTHLGSSLRLEVLVLDGDFRCEDGEGWTIDQFNAATIRAREGKRPLLVGTVNVAMNNHGVAVIDDVSFTDNSSWIRSRKFRIGVRAMPTGYFGVRIQEAVSESFTVKDHRGEFYKKHYPPSLTDNVWRLENIGKEGPIEKRLESHGIKNVQDFLKLNTMNPDKLRTAHVKQLATQAYQQWDQLEEVASEMPLAAIKTFIPISNSGREGSESQGSMISSGCQSVRYCDTIGTPTSSAVAAMATNTSLTSGALRAVSANHDMFWRPSPAPDDLFVWQNSSDDLGSCWDQVD
ncbi:hypothetical protein PR202_gb03463 [Eleusine coracana subsp. coracana]|uniref:Calmodulin-binding protein n=1 Tax=Eleusine coracana subsp. coracana TaxID=191504 RepID=A0AAV5E191_ELECO|nr:hypothetical protein PR202_gb03463 [Eleusine coracana subsp. coracana]